jgi:segregation and condensation protein A
LEVTVENPTFRLEGVIKSKESLEDFEGPLVLILQLISKNKIEIKDIKISDILDQYLEYLDRMKKMDLEIASEFIAMASHLTYIKARTLLAGQDEEVSELEELISSLEELKRRESYERLKKAFEFFGQRAEKGFLTFVKMPEAMPENGQYRYSHEARELRDTLLMLLGREREPAATAEDIVLPARLIYPVGVKSEEIMMKLRERGRLDIYKLFRSCRERTELVATFMAVLELCKSGNLLLEDDEGEYMAVYNAAAG